MHLQKERGSHFLEESGGALEHSCFVTFDVDLEERCNRRMLFVEEIIEADSLNFDCLLGRGSIADQMAGRRTISLEIKHSRELRHGAVENTHISQLVEFQVFAQATEVDWVWFESQYHALFADRPRKYQGVEADMGSDVGHNPARLCVLL